MQWPPLVATDQLFAVSTIQLSMVIPTPHVNESTGLEQLLRPQVEISVKYTVATTIELFAVQGAD